MCVNYMLKSHGFFIPCSENRTDLEGLLSSLGEQIGIGHAIAHVCQALAAITRTTLLSPHVYTLLTLPLSNKLASMQHESKASSAGAEKSPDCPKEKSVCLLQKTMFTRFVIELPAD